MWVFKKKLYKNLFLDTGFHFGGGGGASAPDGGGAFILAHISMGLDFKKMKLTTGYSYVNFFDEGKIISHQLYGSVQIPLQVNYTDFSFLEQEKNDLQFFKNKQANRFSYLLHFNNLSITSEKMNGKNIHLAGMESNKYFTKEYFFYFKADGAYSGIQAGYMDIFIGLGKRFPFNKNKTHFLTKLGIGAGGGGGVDTQGGFLIQPDISIVQNVAKNLSLSINTGSVFSPNLNFTSTSLGLGVQYELYKDGAFYENRKFKKLKLKGLHFLLAQELYIDAHRNAIQPENMQQISLQINYFLNKYLYLSGQTSFANFGGAGAYAEGIVGLGVYSKPIYQEKISLFAQILMGSAGGGGIATGQGLILKPNIGLDYHWNDLFSVRTSFGKVSAFGGTLNSYSFNLGVNYRFSFFKAL